MIEGRIMWKRWFVLCLCIVMAGMSMPMTAYARPDWPADTGIASEAGIVMDLDSDTVLFGQNIHVQKAPASITKLLTALVVIENSDLEDMVTFSHEAVYDVEEGSGNKHAIEEGDTLSVRDCLYLLLLRSSNQAANALAEQVAGSREAFVERMNQKIEELGCKESHFANPSGLNDETQLTSVYDMALIGEAAYENPTLLEIGSAKEYRLPATTNNPEGVTIRSEHQMLDESSENYYPYAVAGKTGYTSIAGQTLVTYAVKDDRRLIAVTMKSTEFTHYKDTIALMDFGFNQFENAKISQYETGYTSGEEPVTLGQETYEPSDLSMDEEAVVTIPRDASFADTEKTVVTELSENHPQGAVAQLVYTYNERNVGQVYLISAKQAAADKASEAMEESAEGEMQTGETDGAADAETAGTLKPALPISAGTALLALAILLLVAAIVGLIFLIRKKQQEEKRRLEERKRRRKERLEEIGCSEEEFSRLLEERKGGK